MNTYTWIAKVTWYFDSEKRTDYSLCYGNTIEEIGEQIDKYYGKDVVEATITYIKEGYFNFENEELAKLILQEKE